MQLPAQVVRSKLALLLRAHFSNDTAETAAHEPILFGALQEVKVLASRVNTCLFTGMCHFAHCILPARATSA